MKKIGPLLLILVSVFASPTYSQNKKFDKSLKKLDLYYAQGNFPKATSSLEKLRNAIVAKMGAKNPYAPGLYIREARINLGAGLLNNFDQALNNALESSMTRFFGYRSTSEPRKKPENAMVMVNIPAMMDVAITERVSR